jgi:uncharacterized protein (TIGR02145 family)
MQARTILLYLAAFGILGCEPEIPPTPMIPPQVSTLEPTDITSNSAIVGGKILEPGSNPITRKGVCFVEALHNTPFEFENTSVSIHGNVIEATGNDLTFTVLMEGLKTRQTYYLRAFAESAAGLKYGAKIKFTTNFETITDIDGNVYRIVKIGNQTWTIDNFNATRLRDGSPIPNRLEDSYWSNSAPQKPAMCWYNNDRATHEKDYGAIYNWYAASHPLIAPEGWRIPTIYDYRDMGFYLRDLYNLGTGWNLWRSGGHLKTTGFEFWQEPNTGATNQTNFSAKAGGGREGTFYVFGYYAVFNCSDEAFGYARSMTLRYNDNQIFTDDLRPKFGGYSLRLIKND